MTSLPNVLSLLRIILTPVFAVLFWQHGVLFLCSIITFTIAALTDSCDGYIARRYGSETKWGAFLDPIADKILIGTTFICCVLKDMVPWWIVLIIIIRDIAVTLLRINALSQHLNLQTTMLAKSKTVFQFITIYAIFLHLLTIEFAIQSDWVVVTGYIAQISVVLVTLLTVYTGIDYAIKYWRLRA